MYTPDLKTSRQGAAGISTGRLFHSRTVLGSKEYLYASMW